MKDEPVDLIKGVNKTKNRSKIALSKGIGKVSGLASQKIQTLSAVIPI